MSPLKRIMAYAVLAPANKPRRHRVIGAVVATTLLVAGQAVVVPALLDMRSVCERTSAWAAANGGNLPNTAAALGAYPVEYRRAALVALPPEVRSRLWIEQFRQFAASRPLTAEQRDVVDLAISLSGPEVYAANGRHSENALAEFRELTRRINDSFLAADRKVFRQFGPDNAGLAGGSPLLVRLRAAVRSLFVANAAEVDCSCATKADCADKYYCGEVEWCEKTTNCGEGQKEKCIGVCYNLPDPGGR